MSYCITITGLEVADNIVCAVGIEDWIVLPAFFSKVCMNVSQAVSSPKANVPAFTIHQD
jgi:hypothetical protein